jgi:hypothetical protein
VRLAISDPASSSQNCEQNNETTIDPVPASGRLVHGGHTTTRQQTGPRTSDLTEAIAPDTIATLFDNGCFIGGKDKASSSFSQLCHFLRVCEQRSTWWTAVLDDSACARAVVFIILSPAVQAPAYDAHEDTAGAPAIALAPPRTLAPNIPESAQELWVR